METEARALGQLRPARRPRRTCGRSTITEVEPDDGVLAVGNAHSCALFDSTVKCWGSSEHGQVGHGVRSNDPREAMTPTEVSGLSSEVVFIAANGNHSCAVTAAGAVKCWGRNAYGQLGDGTHDSRSTATEVVGLPDDIVSVAAGQHHTCALSGSGEVMCWGYNVEGALGDGTRDARTTPSEVVGLGSDIVAITAGAFHTCALEQSGSMRCWGSDGYEQVGGEFASEKYLWPEEVYGLEHPVVAITAGAYHTCALTEGGGLACWGRNETGQLGAEVSSLEYSPVEVSALSGGALGVSAGGGHTCAVSAYEGLECWGYNADGQLGVETSEDNTVDPAGVPGIATDIAAIAAGNWHSCALTATGTLSCWGSNAQGQLGSGTLEDRSTPVAVEP